MISAQLQELKHRYLALPRPERWFFCFCTALLYITMGQAELRSYKDREAQSALILVVTVGTYSRLCFYKSAWQNVTVV
jgi:tryptophan-rich sensory protein